MDIPTVNSGERVTICRRNRVSNAVWIRNVILYNTMVTIAFVQILCPKIHN